MDSNNINLETLRLTDTSGRPTPNTLVPCLMCAKPFFLGLYTGIPDQICGSCEKTYRDCATVICSKCKVTIARVPPTTLDTGYYVRPRAVLHIDKCNICDPEIKTSTVLEIARWNARHGIRRKVVLPYAGK